MWRNRSLAHNKLYRNFIILQEDERSHGISEEKPLSGYAKIEAKSDKCKISFYAQNLNKDDKYTIVLICYKKDLKQIVDLGSLEVTDVGKGEACKEYYINNIAGLDFSYEKVSGAAICKYKDGELSFLMYGFMNGENVKDGWKKCKVLKHADKDDKTFKVDIPKIESGFIKEKKKEVGAKEEYHGYSHKEKYCEKQNKGVEEIHKDEEKCKYYPEKDHMDKYEEHHMKHEEKGHMDECEEHKDDHKDDHMCHEEENKDDHKEHDMHHDEEEHKDDHKEHHMCHEEENKDSHKEHDMNHDEKVHKDKHEEHHMHHHEEDHKDDHEEHDMYHDEKDYMHSFDGKYGYKNKDNGNYKEDYNDYYGDDEYGSIGGNYKERMESGSKFDQYESIIENSKNSGSKFELSGEMGKFFSEIMNGFEEYEDKSENIKYCKWYKINVKNLDDMCNISNYNRYTVAYYPMLNYYPYIRKYGYFMMGYKCDPKGNLKYIVYGVPGSKDENEQPYAGKTGFVTWMNMGNRDEGCWLMFYDFRNSTIVVPMK
jgi:hypothetical protein